jgi:hypothetical protein
MRDHRLLTALFVFILVIALLIILIITHSFQSVQSIALDAHTSEHVIIDSGRELLLYGDTLYRSSGGLVSASMWGCTFPLWLKRALAREEGE